MSQATINFLRLQNAAKARPIPTIADDLQTIHEGRIPANCQALVDQGMVEFTGSGIKLSPIGERARRYIAINNGL